MEDNFEDYDICAIGLQFKGGYSLDIHDHRQNRMLPHVGLTDRSHSLDRAALIGGREKKKEKACMRQKECIVFHLNISKRINGSHSSKRKAQ